MNSEPRDIEWWKPIDDSVTEEDIKRRIAEMEGPLYNAKNCKVVTQGGKRFIVCLFPPPTGS